MQLQGDFADLLPPGGGTAGHRKAPWRSEEMFLTTSKQVWRTAEEPSKRRWTAPRPTSVPSLSWLSCRPAGLQIVLSQPDGRRRLKARKKQEAGGRRCSPVLLRHQHRSETREKLLERRSRPPGPASKAAASGAKTRTSVKDSAPAESGGTEDTQHLPARYYDAKIGQSQPRTQPRRERAFLQIYSPGSPPLPPPPPQLLRRIWAVKS